MMVTERVTVPFEGHGSGVGELSWGQQELWAAMRHRGRWLPIGAVKELPAGTTVGDVVADLRFVMNSYPSLRTRLRFEGDGSSGVEQVVAASGEVTLRIVAAPDDADPAEVAQEVFERYQADDYDYTTEWPIRMAVIRHRGALTHRVWVMCHLVADGSAALVMLRELAQRDVSGSRAAPTALDQARWQGSPAGQQQCWAALAYWEKILRTMPARLFPERGDQASPRYWRATFESPATYLAARVIAGRTGVELASVLLASFVVALTRVLPLNPVVVQVVVNNRFRPRFADTVSPVIQAGVLMFEVLDATIDEVVRDIRGRAMAAYKYSYCDPTRRNALIARVSKERGVDVDTECGFNDRRLSPVAEQGPPPTPEQIRAALADSRFQWVEKQDYEQYAQLYLNVDDAPGTTHLTVTTDTRYLAPTDVEACVRGIEEVAVAAAVDPAERTRSRAVAPAAGQPV